ncbi:MAG: sugar phosphate isomerase/epimerase [Bacteroidales bacterium]|nr:sugar phosphate isomerase/epimerase [Bacteroidales bacterium]
MERRNFIKTAALSTTAAMIPLSAHSETDKKKIKPALLNPNPLKIGVMTYTMAKDWDIETIIRNLTEAKYQTVELRTTHAHKVEVNLTPAQRADVKKRFKDSPLEVISLASGFQYHSPDPVELKKNIEGTKEYILLAHDVGAVGIRVFGNALPVGVPEEKTEQQIGKALAEVGEFGFNNGVEVRICVHGSKTNRPSVIKKIIDYSQSPHVYVNWNCNPEDTEENGFEYNFNLLKDHIRGVHMHELWTPEYPFRQFFKLLSGIGYKGYCNAEIDGNPDPVRFLKYYRALFLAYQDAI